MIREIFHIFWYTFTTFAKSILELIPLVLKLNGLRSELICIALGIPTVLLTVFSVIKISIKVYKKLN